MFQAQSVIVNFSAALKDDVMLKLYENTVNGVSTACLVGHHLQQLKGTCNLQVKAFSNLHPAFARLLCSRLDENHYQSGAAIYKPGDIITHLFIVHQGEVTLVGKNENETIVLQKSK